MDQALAAMLGPAIKAPHDSARVEGPTSCITVRQGEATAILSELHQQRPIARILAHKETGHWDSFMRDKRVRKWCRRLKVQCIELEQNGVTRGLRDRDKFTAGYNKFMSSVQYARPNAQGLRRRLLRPGQEWPSCGLLPPSRLPVAEEHVRDRVDRQRGGETRALALLHSFLNERGEGFSRGISSPNSSWSSCSRLSPYLTWGHISTRRVVHTLTQRQESLRQDKRANKRKGKAATLVPARAGQRPGRGDGWLRSLANFHSRLRWRAHFMQKLESQPEIEHEAQNIYFDHLRAEEGDWNEEFYQAWCKGKTGFPMVDASMRCLVRHGWINFRMRAMLVSFATYNLWLDWKRIAPHLARTFLDYEPGIHYPQLQMQAGVTGINAMRVYNVTKQAKDQDPRGIFIRRYVPELENVPDQWIHEPHKMPLKTQAVLGVMIGESYPRPLVDEASSARNAKAKVAAVRKQAKAKAEAAKVYIRHGSRKRKSKEIPEQAKKGKNGRQQSLQVLLARGSTSNSSNGSIDSGLSSSSSASGGDGAGSDSNGDEVVTFANVLPGSRSPGDSTGSIKKKRKLATKSTKKGGADLRQMLCSSGTPWACSACTFLNDRPLAPTCAMCGTKRGALPRQVDVT